MKIKHLNLKKGIPPLRYLLWSLLFFLSPLSAELFSSPLSSPSPTGIFKVVGTKTLSSATGKPVIEFEVEFKKECPGQAAPAEVKKIGSPFGPLYQVFFDSSGCGVEKTQKVRLEIEKIQWILGRKESRVATVQFQPFPSRAPEMEYAIFQKPSSNTLWALETKSLAPPL